MVAVAILAGGTGGHVMPALAVAGELSRRGAEVHWFGRPQGLEADLFRTQLRADSHSYHAVPAAGVRGKRPWVALYGLLLLAVALVRSWWLLRRLRPAAALGFGGYASLSPACACVLLRIPLVLHEQNSRTGSVNRLLARWAKKLIAGMPGAFAEAVGREPELLGNPLREQMAAAPERPPRGETKEALHLLVFGGSQGARALNQLAPELAAQCEQPLSVRHLCGRDGDAAELARQYSQCGVSAEVQTYTEDMVGLYNWADLALCRAGAMTLAELALAGVPALLVPLPHSIDGHQAANADVWQRSGAARTLPQSGLTADQLAAELRTLSPNLPTMGRAASALAHPKAARDLAQRLLQVAGGAMESKL